ncbi:unnamed protein product [Peronospora farinosa]|uniref:Uncharacterized protein n=1 Tax=Peronospora farinosa TaxID=134698 RepID=A0AAV0UBB8_9STRA|nr:unnamed protein product [Peronospora farinosa]
MLRKRYANDNAAFAAMFPVLAKYLKGDELVKILVGGLTLDKTRDNATKVLNGQAEKLIKSWVDDGKDEAYISFVETKQDKPSRE